MTDGHNNAAPWEPMSAPPITGDEWRRANPALTEASRGSDEATGIRAMLARVRRLNGEVSP